MKNTIKSLCTIGALALTLLSGTVAPVSAQEKLVNFVTSQEDPFERSNAACLEVSNLEASCLRLMKPMTLADYAEKSKLSVDDLLRLNRKAWGSQVNDQTVIPALQRFRFSGVSDEQTS